MQILKTAWDWLLMGGFSAMMIYDMCLLLMYVKRK